MEQDTRKEGQSYPPSELKVGDVVSLEFAGGGFDTAVVKQRATRELLLAGGPEVRSYDVLVFVRPYAVVGDVETTAGVGVSFAYEPFEVGLTDTRKYKLLRKSTVGQSWAAYQKERQDAADEIARLKKVIEDGAARVKSLEQAAQAVDRARIEAERALANVKEDLKRERDRGSRLRDAVAGVLDTAAGEVQG